MNSTHSHTSQKITLPASAVRLLTASILAAGIFLGPGFVRAESSPALLDDFSDAESTSLKTKRILVSDNVAGGQSRMSQKSSGDTLTIEGELSPPRGSPGWANLILPLSPDNTSRDVSAYTGVRLRVKVVTGMLSVQACSPEVTNFDYHNAMVTARPDEFQEVRIPFQKLKRSWSEQTPLNLKNITSINVLAVGFAKGPFAFAIDEIGFY
ncbi:MAG: CIA30 family protein [Nibricoccus sp.]